HGARLMVDDAHGLGVLGAAGRGSLYEAGLGQADAPILVGTLGKALGTSGAFVAGSEALIETLIQHARTYVYTTAMPPAMAVATRHALAIAAGEDWRRERLRALIERFRREAGCLGLTLMPSRTPIQPVVVGGAEAALAAARDLERAGVLVSAIRPPTVPDGTARLRVTLSAVHTDSHLDQLLSALARLAPSR
ncbi:aminotransferase class I/II-fold pyridoxal phosphate-dependent enzyme, partial [Ectothiorhodospiraceae bacterium WFHF3C12]|nr:aminotransferase class I/II-fold pyridoxal phosphate-dependent enzyme [Ectothiorhodospiraceae bacterium WFHF3C12]